MNKMYAYVLITIVICAFLVRIYSLNNNPAGLFCDEAAIGFNAYSVLTTGRDEHGAWFPFFFQSFGTYRTPVPIYSNVPFILIFGLNEFSVRLSAVCW